MKALFSTNTEAVNQVFNIAFGSSTTLLELFEMIRSIAGSDLQPHFGPFRLGDIPHSLATIDKAKTLLDYQPWVSVEDGLKKAFAWYKEHRSFFAD